MASHNTIQAALDKKEFKKVRRLIEERVALEKADFALICKLIQSEQFDLVELALKMGYSPLILNDSGQSALHMCVIYATPVSLVEALVKAGLDINNSVSRVPLDLNKSFTPAARPYGHWKKATPIHYLSWCSPSNVVEMSSTLIHLGADPNLLDFKGQNALHSLCQIPLGENSDFPFLLIAKQLIEAGVDVNHLNNNSESPLMMMVRQQDMWPTARQLVLSGAHLYHSGEDYGMQHTSNVQSNFDYEASEFEIEKEWDELKNLSEIFESKSILKNLSSAQMPDLKRRL